MEFPGEQLLIKMWETLIEKGIGGLIEPYYTPWRNKKLALGQIEVDKIIKDAKASAEREIKQIGSNEPIFIEQNHTTSNYNSISQPVSVQDIVIQNNAKRLIREEINVTNSIRYASQRLINDNSEVPKDEINEDWLNAWRENASKVSNEEVQSLWGNVLAQEFVEPGRYSLRLLEFLKTMSRDEALLLEKIAPYLSQSGILYGRTTLGREISDQKFLSNFEISGEDITLLDELGIISETNTLGRILNFDNIPINENKVVIEIPLRKNTIISFSKTLPPPKKGFHNLIKNKFNSEVCSYPLTKIGREILTLVDEEMSVEYIHWLANEFSYDFDVALTRLVDGNLVREKILKN